MKVNSMNICKTRFAWYNQNAKTNHVTSLASGLLSDLIAAGATFYSYGGEEIMFLGGEVIDIYRKQELLSALARYLNVSDLSYANDIAICLRNQAKPLYQPIPEGVLGTVNGVKESNKIMTKYLNKPVRSWIREVIAAGLV